MAEAIFNLALGSSVLFDELACFSGVTAVQEYASANRRHSLRPATVAKGSGGAENHC